jgi:hypothetical protein
MPKESLYDICMKNFFNVSFVPCESMKSISPSPRVRLDRHQIRPSSSVVKTASRMSNNESVCDRLYNTKTYRVDSKHSTRGGKSSDKTSNLKAKTSNYKKK